MRTAQLNDVLRVTKALLPGMPEIIRYSVSLLGKQADWPDRSPKCKQHSKRNDI